MIRTTRFIYSIVDDNVQNFLIVNMTTETKAGTYSDTYILFKKGSL